MDPRFNAIGESVLDQQLVNHLGGSTADINFTRFRHSGRSVVDFDSDEEIRLALQTCTVSAGHPCGSPPLGKSDWVLPVPDPDAEEQTVNSELRRLLVLKSYLLLDAEKEEAFDRLTEEACHYYNVPTSLISLIDLGRQFLFSNTGAHNAVRETTRTIAFCSHTILSKRDICVVNDCKEDPRFQNNDLVIDEDGPKLRFYAAAPLISPEGYKIGTFCVESPEPRPDGLTEEEQEKLKEYASKTMELMVSRRKKILEKSTAFNLPANEPLRKHAAVSTNLGSIMYANSEFVTAMRLFQESVQALMHVEEDAAAVALPSTERQETMLRLLSESDTDLVDDGKKITFLEKVRSLFDSKDYPTPNVTQSASCPIQSIPGLFSAMSKLKSVAAHRHFHGLIFAEPFKVSLEKDLYSGDPRMKPIDDRSFVIPLEQCSKATLYNMGLIHYHWGSPDSAVQFFDLAASLSRQHDTLSFDPVMLGCLNNMAQVHLQHNRPNDAMELLSDAVVRGNAALVAMYGSEEQADDAQKKVDMKRTRRLRKKLARTVMNMGHVHFVRCNYEAAMATCNDALMLLHTNMDESEVAAVWFNLALLHYYSGSKNESLQHLDKYLEMAEARNGTNHLQVAEGYYRKGQVLYELNNLQDAMGFLAKALEVRRHTLGDLHPAVADAYFLIGKVLADRREYDASLTSFEKVLNIQKALSQDDLSFDVAQTLLDVARVHHLKGDFEESITVYSEVLDLTKKFFGESHPFVSRITTILGDLYTETGEPEKSARCYDEVKRLESVNAISQLVPPTASTPEIEQ
jgi:tetratricopeptide (TPR) repeat protein